MKNLLYILLFILSISLVNAQGQPTFSQYMYNPFSYNPAFAGYYDDVFLNFSGRGNLGGVDGAPRSIMFSAHSQALSEKAGLGANVFSDKIGVTSTTGVYAAYSYNLLSNDPSSRSWNDIPERLSFGISGGISIYEEDLTSLGVDQDPHFYENVRVTVPNFGFGVFYSNDRYYMGLSIPQILSAPEEENIEISRDVYLNGGVQFNFSALTQLQLGTLVKYLSDSPLQYDLNAIVTYNDKFSVGTGYKSISAMNFMLGINISEKFRFGYFYDMPLAENREIDFNAHELMVNFRLAK